MPKILITGNGFDLYHKLPTQYANFIETLNKIQNETSLNLKYTDYFESNPLFDDIVYDENDINRLKSLLDNKWYACFKKELEIDTWIDFEVKLEEVLKVIWYFTKSINETFFKIKDWNPGHHVSFEKEFNLKLKYIIILDYFGIVKIHEANFKYFFFVEEFTNVINYKFTELNDEKISKFLIQQWNGFIDIFDLYINIFVTPLIDCLSKQSTISFDGIDHYFTFNYSNVFEKLYNNCDSNYLHGKLSVESIGNSIVLGFNDIDQSIVNKKFYLPFTKFFQKMLKRTDFKFLTDIEKKYDSYYNYIFYFFGHSLDVSDVEYINDVFDILRNDRKSIVKIFCHNESSRNKLLLNITNILGRQEMMNFMKSDQIIFLNMDIATINIELGTPMPLPDIYI